MKWIWRIIKPLTFLLILVGLAEPAIARQSATQYNNSNGKASKMEGAGTVYLPFISQSGESGSGSWSTVAGNPQRTSWTSEQVTGNIFEGSIHVEWYRPIEAYIPQNVQIIASDGLLYIATSRGLYALDAANGSVRWRFDTELPLGNSPTVDGGIVYVGGFDRKIHALNALNGAHLWSFDDAQAGYSTNPLVVEGKVIAGNRDGYMYAVGAQGTPLQGQLVWKFKAGGPILLSAAYKDGLVYFAANDNYAYALRADAGTLVWKSQKLPGDGYQSYWPVVYTDPTTNKDLVIFSAASGYRFASSPGSKDIEPWQDLFNALFQSSDTIGPVVTINEPWAQGKTVVDYSHVTEYLENNPAPDPYLGKPWRREYIVLNASNGNEYTFDSDHDTYAEYAPVLSFTTGSGNDYPPVVGKDSLLYFGNLYFKNGQGRVVGWRVGTPYMVLSNNQGDEGEPQAYSSGGNLIYRSICCDRVGDWFDATNISRAGILWHYGYTLSDSAPGYKEMWWDFDPNSTNWTSNYGNVNGIYNSHGIQTPIIPYQGRLFIHRSNAVIAFGSGPSLGKLPLLTSNPVPEAMVNPTIDDLKQRLENEVSKIVSQGIHLRPGYYNAGQFNDSCYDLVDYFDNPGDTIYTLSRAYPYLSLSLQNLTKTYLQIEFNAYFDPVMYSHMGWADGIGREAMPLPPEVEANLPNYPKTESAGPAWTWSYPQYNFYAMWKYAQIFPADAGRVYDLAKSKLQVPIPTSATNEYFRQRPWELNGYIAGYIGFLRLQELAGMTVTDSLLRTTVYNEANRLLALRANNFEKDSYYQSFDFFQRRGLNVSRNFIMLVPELGDYLNQHALAKMADAIQEYNRVGPYWFVSRYDAAVAESGTQNLYDYPAMFQAKAYILKQSHQELTKYLDVPAFERGDLFYIQNLIVAIEAP
jgi:outer membrane protein assembly factor BamB